LAQSAPFGHWIVGQWRRPSLAGSLLLRPAAGLFAALTGLRRAAYRYGLFRSHGVDVPVIVVGNLTVGGSGKTPLVAHLVGRLAASGWRPGVITRGYGGTTEHAMRITAEDDPMTVGDEAVMLARRCGSPVARGSDRVAAAALLRDDCDVIIADDGLQHYRLARDFEIVVIDGDSGLGNGRLLPAGPLREAPRRLDTVDAVAIRGGNHPGGYRFDIVAGGPRPFDGPGAARTLTDWHGIAVHAVAGIGVPERFFGQLEDAGLIVERHAFADHHVFRAEDLAFDDERPLLMTEKDAVRCRNLADARMWYVPAELVDHDGLADVVLDGLRPE